MAIISHENEIPAPLNTKIWRYLSKDKFESLLKDKALFFCRADKFSDPFEGSLPIKVAEYRNDYESRLGGNFPDEVHEIQKNNAEGLKLLHQGFKRAVIVNCWHMNNSESDAMWRLYLNDNEGVAVSTTISNLYKSLSNTKEDIGSSRVRYLNYDNDIWFHPVDYPHTGYNILVPLLHKRTEFIHESEFRLYHQIQDAVYNDEYWNHQPNHKGKMIPVEVSVLV
ncbi:MAG: DUF2971 domain-containing protein, partial [Sphingobacteriales bacterium]